MNKGALGCEIRLSGKLPSERAKSWRFSEGYLKKAGDSTKEVDMAQTTALTKTGIIGIKVAIMRPDAKLFDRVYITEEVLSRIRIPSAELKIEEKKEDKEKDEKKESSLKDLTNLSAKKNAEKKESNDNKDIKPKKPGKAKLKITEKDKDLKNLLAKKGEEKKSSLIKTSEKK